MYRVSVFRDVGLRVRVWGLGFKIKDLDFRVQVPRTPKPDNLTPLNP